jgi:hypothetical protein
MEHQRGTTKKMAGNAAGRRRDPRTGRGRARRTTPLSIALAVLLVVAGTALASSAGAQTPIIEVQSLDGSGNNRANPDWGRSGTNYSRVAPARYADNRGAMVAGPNSRRVSNRIFNDANQNLFSERRVTQWGFTWGQFLDHTFGLRLAPGVGNSPDPSSQNIPFDRSDPMESFVNDLGNIPFTRSAIAPGTGVNNPREQVNTVSSYIDAWAVYGGANERLEWLREGPVDGNLANNGARLLLTNGLLPRRDSRGNAAAAPVMDVDGRLRASPNRAMVAGDVRANENIALTATHTLFAREHNRIVGLLPNTLSEEQKFQLARRVVIAEQQYVTYNEFLPALGIQLPAYTGYKSNVNANLGNEFATVGYRAHSQIHGEIELETDADRYSQATLDALEAQGVEIAVVGDDIEMAVPLNVAFFNPDIIAQLQLGPLLQGIGLEAEYNNDEQIDNQLRSVLFQVPVTGNPECLDGPTLPQCFRGVVDLGAIDVERGRDHGMPTYNQLRAAFGLPAKTSFRAITGESTELFPSDPQLTPGNEANDPDSLDFTALFNIDGARVPLDSEEAEATATRGTRRTPLAARLRAVYGNVNNVDAFTGMIAERHLPGSEFGELQRAIWTRQFQALRDGDRFFYGNDPGLTQIKNQFGIDYRRNLGDIIASNTDIPRAELNGNVFLVADDALPPVACHVDYTVTTSWPGNFQVAATITNRGTTPINGWTLRWEYANGQRISQLWDGTNPSPSGNVVVSNASWNPTIAANGGRVSFGFNATFDNVTNADPPNFTLNNARCTGG